MMKLTSCGARLPRHQKERPGVSADADVGMRPRRHAPIWRALAERPQASNIAVQPKAYRRVPIRGCAPIGTRRKCGLGEEIRAGVSSALRAARDMRFPLETSQNPRNPLVSKRRPFVGVVRYNPLVQST